MVSMKAAARLALVSLAFAGVLAAQAEPLPGAAARRPQRTPGSPTAPHGPAGRASSPPSPQPTGAQPPAPGGVVFVGSSTIRMWSQLAQDFRAAAGDRQPRLRRLDLADCSLFARELVVRYKPRQVVVYAGDNDLAEGRTPLQVLDSFARFAGTVRADLPDTRISFISVKPSPSREQLLPQIRETNNVIAAYLQQLPNSDYIDIYTPMLGADGRPRAGTVPRRPAAHERRGLPALAVGDRAAPAATPPVEPQSPSGAR